MLSVGIRRRSDPHSPLDPVSMRGDCRGVRTGKTCGNEVRFALKVSILPNNLFMLVLS